MNKSQGDSPFRYAAFISYVHGQKPLMDRFVTQLQEALESELEPYFENPVYIDRERHVPGDLFNTRIAQALCHSACMILIFVPKYTKHVYTVRELEAMMELQRRRFASISQDQPPSGLIIPILLRGSITSLPAGLRNHVHVCDFSRYMTTDMPLLENERYIERIRDIAEFIWERYTEFVEARWNPDDCDNFTLPEEVEVEPSTIQFPGRVPGR